MATEEQKYFEKLNIPVLSIAGIKELIKDDIIDTIKCWEGGRDIEKQCFHIIGPAGVGKTSICDQMRVELKESTGKDFEMIMVKSPVLSRDDIMIPFPVVGDGQKTFEMLYSDFVPKGEACTVLASVIQRPAGPRSSSAPCATAPGWTSTWTAIMAGSGMSVLTAVRLVT